MFDKDLWVLISKELNLFSYAVGILAWTYNTVLDIQINNILMTVLIYIHRKTYLYGQTHTISNYLENHVTQETVTVETNHKMGRMLD